MPTKQNHAPGYRHIARVYDALASAYSLGAIDRAKADHHRLIKPGHRVLYAGAGRGREIAEACKQRAEVTCVEPCPAMAAKLHARLSSVADHFTIVPKPIESIPAEPVYDLAVAHFFLNVFDPVMMPDVLAHLCGFVRPGGQLIVADFKPAKKDAIIIDRALRQMYYRPVNLAGRLLRICALHPIYDYAPLLTEHGFSVHQRQPFRVLPGLPPLYETLTALRMR